MARRFTKYPSNYVKASSGDKYGYDIICRKPDIQGWEGKPNHLVMDNGEMEFDDEADAWLDAKETISDLIHNGIYDEYANCTPDDFYIDVYKLDY